MFLNCLKWFFSKQLFILGCRYPKEGESNANFSILFWGRAKMAVYMSRRNKVEGSTDDNAVFVFVKMLKARLKIDFIITG